MPVTIYSISIVFYCCAIFQVLGDSHNLQGRTVEPQRAKARGSGGSRSSGSKKLYLGGLDDELLESDIRDHFSAFGSVSIAVFICIYFDFISL